MDFYCHSIDIRWSFNSHLLSLERKFGGLANWRRCMKGNTEKNVSVGNVGMEGLMSSDEMLNWQSLEII